MGTNFTNETLSLFYNETIKGFIEYKEKMNTQTESIKRLEDLIDKLRLEKAVANEKNENLLYKLSVMNDKILASEQRVNDLNTIMMKHFAYRTNGPTPVPTQPEKTTSFNFNPNEIKPFKPI
jgi:chromosome segregation ATPase